LAEYMQPFLFLEPQCHPLSVHKVTFSLNCSTLTYSLNYNTGAVGAVRSN
jgi:hypothetical protein